MVDYGSHNDHELAGLLRADDEAVFKVIYDRYWEKLYFIASKRLGNQSEAEEAIQDIFLNLWKNRRSFELKEGFDNYLAVAVKFQVIKRRAKSLRRSVIDQQIRNDTQNEDLQINSWSQYDLELLQKRLNTAIDTLPPKCKLVFTMSRDDDYTNKKIAEELGISEKAVEKHITHALKVLRSKLGHYVVLVLFLKGIL